MDLTVTGPISAHMEESLGNGFPHRYPPKAGNLSNRLITRGLQLARNLYMARRGFPINASDFSPIEDSLVCNFSEADFRGIMSVLRWSFDVIDNENLDETSA